MPARKSLIQLTTTPEDHRVAQLAAAAIGLSLIDAAIPLPLPGVKPGLANIVTLIVLERYGWVTAAWVSGLRVFAGSLLLGHFLSPGFFMSCSGALCSLLTLALAIHLPRRWFGPVSWSVLAAFAHISGQLVLARLWLIPHDGLFLLVPFFAAAALTFGTINGLIAARLLAEQPAKRSSQDATQVNENAEAKTVPLTPGPYPTAARGKIRESLRDFHNKNPRSKNA